MGLNLITGLLGKLPNIGLNNLRNHRQIIRAFPRPLSRRLFLTSRDVFHGGAVALINVRHAGGQVGDLSILIG